MSIFVLPKELKENYRIRLCAERQLHYTTLKNQYFEKRKLTADWKFERDVKMQLIFRFMLLFVSKRMFGGILQNKKKMFLPDCLSHVLNVFLLLKKTLDAGID